MSGHNHISVYPWRNNWENPFTCTFAYEHVFSSSREYEVGCRTDSSVTGCSSACSLASSFLGWTFSGTAPVAQNE